jgi:transcriptional regulator with XRE-family HTH domain
MDLGSAIRILRQKQNMTQAQLAERVGISINAVSSMETGKSFPPKATVERLCGAFDIPVSYFLISTIEEKDIPEEKRVLYRALLEPFRNELLDKQQ